MVGQLIHLRWTIQRHNLSWKRQLGLVLGLVAAVGTWVAVLMASAGARSDVLGTVLAMWLVGWLIGPILSSGASVLRPEYFVLLPLDRRRLGLGLLASVFVGVGTVVTLLGAAALIGHGVAHGSVGAGLVGLAAAVLFVVLVVSLSRAVYAALGAAMRSQLGVEIASIQYGLLISSVMVGWLAVSPVVSAVPVFLGEGFGEAAAAQVLAWTPAGWPVAAVDAAATGDWVAVARWLGLLAAAATGTAAVAAAMLTPHIGNRTSRRRRRRRSSGISSGSPLGAVAAKELRAWWRDPWRSLEVRSSIWFGIFLAVFGVLGGLPQLAALGGLGVAMMVGLGGANLYGQDGTALWQLVVAQSPAAVRADVRGRQIGLLIYFGVPATVVTVLLMAITSTFELALPVLSGLVAMLGAGCGVAVLMSVLGVTPGVDPHRRINPTDAGENNLVIQASFWLLSTLVVPTAAMAVFAYLRPPGLPSWFGAATVAVALVNGGLVGWGLGELAVRQLQRRLPETFARIRYAGTGAVLAGGGGLLDRFASEAEKSAIAEAKAKAGRTD